MSHRRKVLLIISVLLFASIDISFIFIVPVFAEMFADFGAPLPKLTQALIDFAWFSRQHSVFYIPLYYSAVAGATVIAIKKEKKAFALFFVLSALVAVATLVVALFLPVFQLGTVAPN